MTATFIDHSTVELIKHNAADEDVAYAAWVSNFAAEARNRDTSRIAGLINFLYREKHMSPFEHASFTFFIDTTLFVAREFMRHRTFSYNETSGRYKEMEGRFYVPPFDRPLVQKGKVGAYTFEPGTIEMYQEMIRDQMESFEFAWAKYQKQLSYGVAKEVARNVLPLSLYTQFYATANPRNVMQFLILRNDKHALKEIRDVAARIEEEFAKAMPLTYAAFDKERETWNKIKRLFELADLDELLELAERGDFK
nr:thymidylate synthase, flavin-dependent [uncultured bacterium]